MLTFFVPPTFGFSLMSAIDYRADTFSSFYFIACLALLEHNRKQGSRGLAVACGLLAFVAAGMTQKMSFIAGLSLGAMLMTDLVMRLPWLRNLRGVGAPFLARPLYFVLAGALPTAILITAGGALGVLELAFESTILQAIEHEQTYVRFSLFGKGYVTPFLARTALTTMPILAFALVFLPTRAGRFWIFPIGVSILGGSLMVAPYPYNFVFLCWAGVLASVRGFALAVSWLGARFSFLKEAHPLFYLLPLIVYSNQMSFVTGATSNEHQLETLERLERYGEPTDAIIDNAGGGLFSPDGSYYFHHGAAHRRIFREYFETKLVDDYRRSRALFWVRDLRSKAMPQPVQDYLESHYLSGGGNLFVMGFSTPRTRDFPEYVKIDVVRAGRYYIHLSGPRPRRGRPFDLVIDGKPVTSARMILVEGVHEVMSLPYSPTYLITLVPASFFDFRPSKKHYSMMFEYRDPKRRRMRHLAAAGRKRTADEDEMLADSADAPEPALRAEASGESDDEEGGEPLHGEGP